MTEQEFIFFSPVFIEMQQMFKSKTESVGCIFKHITIKLYYQSFHQIGPHKRGKFLTKTILNVKYNE